MYRLNKNAAKALISFRKVFQWKSNLGSVAEVLKSDWPIAVACPIGDIMKSAVPVDPELGGGEENLGEEVCFGFVWSGVLILRG